MTKRNDCHRPGAIIPADYEHVLVYSGATVSGGWPIPPWNIDEAVRACREALETHRVWGSVGKCGVCGARYIFGALFRHIPTGDLVHFGRDCTEKYGALADFAPLEAATAVAIAAAQRAQRTEDTLEAHPGLREAFVVVEGAAPSRGRDIVLDIKDRLGRFDLTDRQVALVMRIAGEVANPAPAPTRVAAPTGKVSFSGAVLSTRYSETRFGTQLKMLVEVATDGGTWLAWSTVPSAIADTLRVPSDLKGRRVELTATLTHGNEPHFAFASRPKGRLLD